MIAIVATARIKDGMQEQFEKLAKQLSEAVQEHEPDCQLYLLTRSKTDANRYIFLERYTDEAALKHHTKQPYMGTVGRELFACMDGKPDIQVLDEV